MKVRPTLDEHAYRRRHDLALVRPRSFTGRGGRMTVAERNALVEHCLPMVRNLASRVAMSLPASVDRADLVSAASLALLTAVERYDASRGKSVEVFAYGRALGAMRDFLRASDPLPRSIRQRLLRFATVRDEMAVTLGREPSEPEVHDRCGFSERQRRKMAQARWVDEAQSYDAPFEIPMRPRSERMAALAAGDDPVDAVVQHDRREAVRAAVRALPRPLSDIVWSTDIEREPLAVIAERLGVTDGRISQLRRKAHALLRTMLTGTAVDPAA